MHLARLVGANRAYIEEVIPHIGEILSDDLAATVAHGELVVIGNPAPEFKKLAGLMRSDQRVLDLVRILASMRRLESGMTASTGKSAVCLVAVRHDLPCAPVG